MTKDTKTNESKIKSTLNGASYTRLYFYLGIFVAIFCSYLFFFKTNDSSDILLQSSSKTATAQIEPSTESSPEIIEGTDNNSTSEQESNVETTESSPNPEPSTTETNTVSTTKPPQQEETPLKEPEQASTPSNTSTNTDDGLIPVNNYNKQYSSLNSKSYIVKKGQSLSALFKENGLSQADINAMDGVNRKAASSLHDGDKILIKVDNKKVVVLAIIKKNGEYFGQFVWTGSKYEFIGK